ncbi:MAG TPA: HD domain-containing phosphohydrolase [Solirubrobacterales bacterium]|nr:HD domain-containing phosphohydrolase [Solirubrobacterales bacterium]
MNQIDGTGGGRRPRILATDDRPEVLRLIERSLAERYDCELAGSVEEARDKLSEQSYELALCDIQMPSESGLILVSEIAREHPETAIVMASGVDDPAIADHAFQLGAHGYIVKPFWAGQLLITVANALRQHELELVERRRHEALLGSTEEKAQALQNELIAAQRRAIEDLRVSQRETVERLARAIEMHDPETGRHVNRMAAIAALLGAKLELEPGRLLLLRTAAPMHDVGKIATPDGVLRKQDRLTPDERTRMQAHTTVGYEILRDSRSELLRMAAEIALTHHEWFDGSGYPRGLSGEKIPIEGRIVAVADVFDALLSDRPYREAMSVVEATELIASERGTHFDPAVVDALLDCVDEAARLRG